MMNGFTTSLVLVMASTANAGYIGSVVGLVGDDEVSSLTINAGDSFTGAVMLDGAGTRSDFALFRLLSSASNLEYSAGWYEWSTPFTTGGIDDYSSPGPNESGVIDEDTYSDPFAPGEIDVVFENLTDTFGDYFGTGMILTFTLIVPDTFAEGSFTLDFASDTFTDGASFVDAESGQGLTVNVIPSPASTSLMALFGVLAVSRRR
tara:strand:+ start:29321 stop:29935 length:615 start_codon:yes stop_codon:yes gene_type:complete